MNRQVPAKKPKDTKKKSKKQVTECNVTGELCEHRLESCVGASCSIFCSYACGEEY